MIKLWIYRILLLVALSPVIAATIYGIILNAGDSSTQGAFAFILVCVIFSVFMTW